MLLQRLSLTNYLNYARLELNLPAGLSIIQGQNAQGKSNLLEAIAYLATSKSARTGNDTELVNWLVQQEPYPYTRPAAEIRKADRLERLDITLLPAAGNGGFRKQVRVNNVPKRAIDLVGLLLVVLLRPEDVDLVAGAPSERRRYLDIALCQIDPASGRALSQYNKALEQRNALLRALQHHGQESAAQLRFWDEKLAETGSVVIARRQWLIIELEKEASLRHLDLSGGYERLHMRYLPSFDPGRAPGRGVATEARHDNAGDGERSAADGQRPEGVRYENIAVETVYTSFLAHLYAGRHRDLAAGTTQIGPHRDDLGFYLGRRNLRSFGSRGQQRTASLSSKLAEVGVMTQVTGTSPLLLLDDVMSELDASRRAMLIDALTSVPQAIVTTTDWEPFAAPLLAQANRLHVQAGQLEPAPTLPAGGAG